MSSAQPPQQIPSASLKPMIIVTGLNRTELSDQIEQRLKVAYAKLGYVLQVERLPGGRSMRMANQGDFDGELFRIQETQNLYPNLLLVPIALARINLHAFVHKEHQNLENWQQDVSLRIAYVRGFQMAEQYPFAGKRIALNTLTQGVQMLLQHKVDVLLEDPVSMLSVTAELASNEQPIKLPSILSSAELYHFLHKKHQAMLQPLASLLAESATAQ